MYKMKIITATTEESQEERPPVFSTWRRLYFAVLGNLVLLVVIFYLISRIFS